MQYAILTVAVVSLLIICLVREQTRQAEQRVSQERAEQLTELGARTSELQETVASLKSELERTRAKLLEAEQRIQELTMHDTLCDLPDQRAFVERLTHEYLRSGRHGTGLGILIVDMDRFSRINMIHGTETGDAVLKSVAEILVNSVRSTDMVARYSGQTFGIILTETTDDGAMLVAERVRSAISSAELCEETVTASIGIAMLGPKSEGPSSLLDSALNALTNAKKAGRDTVAQATPPGEPSSESLTPPIS